MEVYTSYKQIPEAVVHKMKDANVFYSENYYNYIFKTGAECWYIMNENFIIVVDVFCKVFIKYALLPSEPFCISDSNTISNFLKGVEISLQQKRVAWVISSAAALLSDYSTNSIRIPFGSHVIDLTLSEEAIWSNMHSKHRNSIRRAEKNGVLIKKGRKELINDYIKIDRDTWERSHKKAYGMRFFEIIISSMNDNAIIYIAYKDDVPQAGACYFLNPCMSYYMYGASKNSPEPGATNYLHWVAINDFKSKGIKKYSFVGCRIDEDENSKYHSIQRFKERFGGELFRGYMQKTILDPRLYFLYKLLFRLKNKHNYSDPVDQEIVKWESINN